MQILVNLDCHSVCKSMKFFQSAHISGGLFFVFPTKFFVFCQCFLSLDKNNVRVSALMLYNESSVQSHFFDNDIKSFRFWRNVPQSVRFTINSCLNDSLIFPSAACVWNYWNCFSESLFLIDALGSCFLFIVSLGSM